MGSEHRPSQKVKKALEEYRAKRDFAVTPEPKDSEGSKSGRLFVIQKHDATSEHFDLRLELDGVLLSWAVPKGPSLDPATRRLAMRTEDHPVAYGDFEGVIPEDEYGGGTVMLFDQGRWEPNDDPHEGLEKGKLSFEVKGTRMKGNWALVRSGNVGGGDRESWLLIKEKDNHTGQKDLADKHKTSAVTGRSMEEIAQEESPEGQG